MNILVTGGAGYIGSHVVKQLLEDRDHSVTIIDNLSTGSRKTLDTLRTIGNFNFMELDLKEFDKILPILEENKIDTIIHFAASIVVPESVAKPLDYYMNNIVNSTNLIDKAIKSGVERFIFSSTAAVYGEPSFIPEAGLDESFPTVPINPYGVSKLMTEIVLKDASFAYPKFKHVAFRYFNVAGADIHYNDKVLEPRIGQSFPNATHLIKIASECATRKREKMAIFGDDFDTNDGTGVRDYIHIDDLASAHIEAIEYLKTNDSDTFNVGYGKGYSVKEVIERVKDVTKSDFTVDNAPRRAGDPATLISNNSKIKQKMNWTPKYDNLALICQSAFEWEKRLV